MASVSIYLRELRSACADVESSTIRIWHVAVVLALALPMGVVGLVLGDTIGADRSGAVVVTIFGVFVWGALVVALRRRLAHQS